MNTIKIDKETKPEKIIIKEDTNILINELNSEIEIEVLNDCLVFEYITNSNIKTTYNINSNLVLNRFIVDSSNEITINLNKENIKLEYCYSNININDNKYKININHNKRNTISNIINHGINIKSNKLDYIINSIIPKQSNKTITNQDSKIIILEDNNCLIKPNLIIENDDIIANHSSYIGYFNKEKMFYLNTRGLNNLQAEKLLAKSFLLNNMNVSYIQNNLILQNINKYWR